MQLRSDLKKKWKWEAWNACTGIQKEAAMLAFIKEVEKLDPTFRASSITLNIPGNTAGCVCVSVCGICM